MIYDLLFIFLQTKKIKLFTILSIVSNIKHQLQRLRIRKLDFDMNGQFFKFTYSILNYLILNVYDIFNFNKLIYGIKSLEKTLIHISLQPYMRLIKYFKS